MYEKFSNLLTVKSIVTILLTLTFVYLSGCRVISADQFQTVYSIIIAFYFGTQYERKNNALGGEGK